MAIPKTVNFHITSLCNARCRFCFARFPEIRGHALDREAGLRLIAALAEAGVQKLTFAGGEPTLFPHISDYLRASRAAGLVTGLVSNGANLEALLHTQHADLDWVGLSLDSADNAVQTALGRTKTDHRGSILRLAALAQRYGVKVKLNSVITALNWQEDMRGFVAEMRPDRWKVFQVLEIQGENDHEVGPLLIDDAQFAHFLDTHAGLYHAAEDNTQMLGAYAMIDPLGRAFNNRAGAIVTSRGTVLELGLEEAMRQVEYDEAHLMARGGLYNWGAPAVLG